MRKNIFLPLLICLNLMTSCSDETTNSNELSGTDTIYHEYIINFNQESQSLYAEAELTRQRRNNTNQWFVFSDYDYIKLVGDDKLTFNIINNEDKTYVLKPTRLTMDKKQVFWGSKTVPYYRLSKNIPVEEIEKVSMAFSYYSANDSRTYTYQSELLVPNLLSVESSSGDVLDTLNNDTLTLTFDESIDQFDKINLEFVNSYGNSFFFSMDPKGSNEFVIESVEIRDQAINQSFTIKEHRKRKLGNLRIESAKEKDVPLLLAGVEPYKLNITAKRLVKEEVIYSQQEHHISVQQSIKVYEKNIKISF